MNQATKVFNLLMSLNLVFMHSALATEMTADLSIKQPTIAVSELEVQPAQSNLQSQSFNDLMAEDQPLSPAETTSLEQTTATLTVSTTQVNVTLTKEYTEGGGATSTDALQVTNQSSEIVGWRILNNDDAVYIPNGGYERPVPAIGFGLFADTTELAAGENRTVRAYTDNTMVAGTYSGSYTLQAMDSTGMFVDIATISYTLNVQEPVIETRPITNPTQEEQNLLRGVKTDFSRRLDYISYSSITVDTFEERTEGSGTKYYYVKVSYRSWAYGEYEVLIEPNWGSFLHRSVEFLDQRNYINKTVDIKVTFNGDITVGVTNSASINTLTGARVSESKLTETYVNRVTETGVYYRVLNKSVLEDRSYYGSGNLKQIKTTTTTYDTVIDQIITTEDFEDTALPPLDQGQLISSVKNDFATRTNISSGDSRILVDFQQVGNTNEYRIILTFLGKVTGNYLVFYNSTTDQNKAYLFYSDARNGLKETYAELDYKFDGTLIRTSASTSIYDTQNQLINHVYTLNIYTDGILTRSETVRETYNASPYYFRQYFVSESDYVNGKLNRVHSVTSDYNSYGQQTAWTDTTDYYSAGVKTSSESHKLVFYAASGAIRQDIYTASTYVNGKLSEVQTSTFDYNSKGQQTAVTWSTDYYTNGVKTLKESQKWILYPATGDIKQEINTQSTYENGKLSQVWSYATNYNTSGDETSASLTQDYYINGKLDSRSVTTANWLDPINKTISTASIDYTSYVNGVRSSNTQVDYIYYNDPNVVEWETITETTYSADGKTILSQNVTTNHYEEEDNYNPLVATI